MSQILVYFPNQSLRTGFEAVAADAVKQPCKVFDVHLYQAWCLAGGMFLNEDGKLVAFERGDRSDADIETAIIKPLEAAFSTSIESQEPLPPRTTYTLHGKDNLAEIKGQKGRLYASRLSGRLF